MEYELDHISEDDSGNLVAYVQVTVGTNTKTVCLPYTDKATFKTDLANKAAQVKTQLTAKANAETDVKAALSEIKAG